MHGAMTVSVVFIVTEVTVFVRARAGIPHAEWVYTGCRNSCRMVLQMNIAGKLM